MNKNIKPNCRYGCFKGRCPEKPYYIRENYPWGNIKGVDSDGCQFWYTDFVHQNSGGKTELRQVSMCIDFWNVINANSQTQFQAGTQQATEQLRNASCVETERIDANGKTFKVYEQKINPVLTQLCLIITKNQDIINNFLANIQSKINEIEENKKPLLEVIPSDR